MKITDFPDAPQFTTDISTDNARRILVRYQLLKARLEDDYAETRPNVRKARHIFRMEFDRDVEMYPIIGYDNVTKDIMFVHPKPQMFRPGREHRLDFRSDDTDHLPLDSHREDDIEFFVASAWNAACQDLIQFLYGRDPLLGDCIYAFCRQMILGHMMSVLMRCMMKERLVVLDHECTADTKMILSLMAQRVDELTGLLFPYLGLDPVRFDGSTAAQVVKRYTVRTITPSLEHFVANGLCTEDGTWNDVCDPPLMPLWEIAFPQLEAQMAFVRPITT